MNEEMTHQCIARLKKIIQTDSKIVIVDNCSPNGSGEQLEIEYENDPNIIVLINKSNEGFAKGNNLGYAYAKKYFHPSLIVVMNNDILIKQNNFEDIIINDMESNNLDVCGPDIITSNGIHQNPLWHQRLNSFIITKYIIEFCIKKYILDNKLFFNIFQKIKKSYTLGNKREKYLFPNVSNKSLLCGACIIFGSRYIQEENFAFLPITFMYWEEDILFDYLKYKKYTIGFLFNAKVIHKEGVATKTSLPEKQNRSIFVYDNYIHSLKALFIVRIKIIFRIL